MIGACLLVCALAWADEPAPTEAEPTEDEVTDDEVTDDEVTDEATEDDRPFAITADDPVERARVAEVRRLGEEAVAHAAAGRQDALLRTYRQLLELSTTEIDPQLHLLAADASVARGRIAQAVARLQRVRHPDHVESAAETLASLQTRYGAVRISAAPGSELSCPARFVPDEQAAVRAAAEAIAADGAFVGLLPAITCTVAGQELTVVAGGHAGLAAE